MAKHLIQKRKKKKKWLGLERKERNMANQFRKRKRQKEGLGKRKELKRGTFDGFGEEASRVGHHEGAVAEARLDHRPQLRDLARKLK